MIETPYVDPEDRLVCLGHEEDPSTYGGSLTPPIHQSALFAHSSLDELASGLDAEHRHNVYSRGQNPTVEVLERKLARLERGEACKCFASGMGAVSATLFGLLEAGAHVLFVNRIYGPTLELAERFKAYGVGYDLVSGTDLDAVAAALRPETRLVWMESPATLTFKTIDIAAITELAHDRGALAVIDNSWATPLFQKPLEIGVDLVVQTASKYLGGHSDVMAGAVIADGERIERLFYDAYLLLGASLAPNDAWLIDRGLRTLPERMKRHHRDGLAVARHLDAHPRVRRVLHPALDTDVALVERQLRGYSGLFSIELDVDSYEDLARFVDRLTLFRIGVSWGGVESLVITPNRGPNREALEHEGIPPSLVRLSIGLEGAEALIADLDRALEA